MKHKNIHARILITFCLTVPPHELFGQVENNPHAILSARLKNGEESSLPDKCGLPAISAAMHDRSLLTPLERSALERVLIRPSRQKSIDRGNFFRVHYDTTGTDAPAMLNILGQRRPGTYDEFADSVASSARYSYNYIVDTLGYPPPPSDGGTGGDNRYDIYITELGNTYGTTSPDDNGPAGYRTSSFIEMDNDFIFVSPASNRGIPALRVTMAHEFFHAIQMGNYGFWTGDIYFYEISSVWIEDVVYTDVNDYYQYLRSPFGHFMNPEVPFTTANGSIEYSRGIWGQFIEGRYGRDAMKRSWEAIRLAPPLQAIQNALTTYFASFRLAFAEWTLWNYFTGYRSDTSQYPQGRNFRYPEARQFPTIKQNAVEFTPPSRTIEGATTPLKAFGSKYYQIMIPADTLTDTLTLALSNINFDAALHDPAALFPYRYLLNVNRVDGSYNPTGVGVFYKLEVPDLSNWWTWPVTKAGIGKPSIAEGVVFPNPFRPDRVGAMRIAIRRQEPVPGTLRIFSSSMDLVYSISSLATRFIPDVWGFEWNGKTDKNAPAGSGVYFYVLELLSGETIKGKFALVRK